MIDTEGQTYLEESVTLLPCLLSLCWVNIRLLVVLGLCLFGLLQLGKDIGCSVLSQGFAKELDSLFEVALLLVG